MPLLITKLNVPADAHIFIFQDSRILHEKDILFQSCSWPGRKCEIQIRIPHGGISETLYQQALLQAEASGFVSVAIHMPENMFEIRKLKRICEDFLQQSDMSIYLLCSPDQIIGLFNGWFSSLRAFLGDQPVHSPGNAPLQSSAFSPEQPDFTPYTCQPFETSHAMPEYEAACPSALDAKSPLELSRLTDFLKQNDVGFRDTLLKYIDRSGQKDSQVYKKANIDRRLYSKIINTKGYNPSKPTAIAFAIALELDLEETKDLISRAGYTLSRASVFDRIIEFFILERNYDIYQINEALFYFDQSLLGC